MIQQLFPNIPTRVKNRLEKWTAFTLVAGALIWNNRYFNNRLNTFEDKYIECMENRIKDAKEQTSKSTYHEAKIKTYIANTEIFSQAAQRGDHPGRGGRRNPYGPGIIATNHFDYRRLRGSGWIGRRRGFPINEG